MKITKKKKELYRDYLSSQNSCSDEALQQNVLDETIFKNGSFSLFWFSLKQILCSERKRLSCQRLLVFFFFFWFVFLFCFVLFCFSEKTTFPMNFWGTASNISRLKGHKVPTVIQMFYMMHPKKLPSLKNIDFKIGVIH